MRSWLIAGLLGALAGSTTAGCAEDDVFFCNDNSQCMEGGVPGICQSNSLCSFPEAGCPSGHKYGMHAGTLSGQCVGEDEVDDTGGTSAASIGANTTSGGSATTTPVDSTGSADATGAATTATTEPPGSSDGGPVGLPNGSDCVEGVDCESGFCFPSTLAPDVCSECLTDADCMYGCNPSSPFDPHAVWAECNDGGLGAACESEASCAFLAHSCVTLVDVPGFISLSTCSECATDADCAGSNVCNLFFDATAFSGGFACAPIGSVPNGDFCTPNASGEAACANHCAVGTINGFFEFGICSACATDADCDAGQTCSTAEVDLGTGQAVPAVCM